jgi:GntR family transcriptional regulator/MocR family aminotransferase
VEQIRRRILPRRGIMASDDEILITLGRAERPVPLSSLLVDRTSKVGHGRPLAIPDARNMFRLRSEQREAAARR